MRQKLWGYRASRRFSCLSAVRTRSRPRRTISPQHPSGAEDGQREHDRRADVARRSTTAPGTGALDGGASAAVSRRDPVARTVPS